MSRETVDRLLVEWEVARMSGTTVSVEQLCEQHPELVGEVRQLISKLRATTWMLDDSTDSDERHDAQRENRSTPVVTVACLLEKIRDTDLSQLAVDFPIAPDEQPEEYLARLQDAEAVTPYQADVLLGRNAGPLQLDRYLILDVLGSGGMGDVYQARHRSMDRIVALKVLPAHGIDSPQKVARFEREIKATAQISHPHMVTAFDANQSGNIRFLVMEYVAGQNLWQVVQERGPFSPEQSVRVIGQVADAMATAHEHGIIHRDIKPANIILTNDNDAKLLDLGVARMDLDEAESDELTHEGLAIGTVAFMAPEQALNSKHADERSDIYSLACTLYFLIAGRAPFIRQTSVETLVAHREDRLPSLSADNSSVPDALNEVIQRAMAKDPNLRPQTMDDFRQELAAAIESPPVVHRRTTARRGSAGFRRRGITLTLFALAIVALVIWSCWPQGPSEREIGDWVLKNGGALRCQFADQRLVMITPASEDPRLPEEFGKIVGVDLSMADVDSLDMPLRLRNLRWLSASEVILDEKQLRQLSRHRSLQHLELIGCGVTDANVSFLQNLTELKTLDLTGNTVNGQVVGLLPQPQKLQTLRLGATYLDDDGIQEGILQCHNLRDLDVGETDLTSSGVQPLVGLQQLKSLDLQGIDIDGQAAAAVAQLHKLTHLQLDDASIDDKSIGKIVAGLPKLQRLFLSGTLLEDAGLRQIAALKELTHLDISDTDVSREGIKALPELKSLEWLRASDLNAAGSVVPVVVSLTELRWLDLSGTAVDDKGLKKLVRLKKLSALILDETDVTKSGVIWLEGRLPNCSVLWQAGS